MSKIEDLIAELCPDGVEYKKLEAVADFRRGSFPQPYGESRWYGGNNAMPFIQVADVANNLQLVETSKQMISELAQPKSIFVPAGTVVVTLQGTIGRVAITQYDSYVDRTLAIFETFKITINKKYFAYQLKQKFEFEKAFARGSTLKTITKEEFRKFTIPIPPPAIQEEIVRILDNFTELTAELTASLTDELLVRKQQYKYYRDSLLTFGDDVEWKTLGEISTKSYSGGTPLANCAEYYGGDIPWLRTQEVRFVDIYDTKMRITAAALKNSSAKWIPANCVIIAISGATAGRSAINRIPLTTNQHCCCLEIDPNKANYRYVFHWVCSQYENLKALGQGARSDLNSGIIKSYLVPLPRLEKQARIVVILDRFDILINDITIGLTTEIAARKQQYEYYRDKLLTFKECER